jgi:hypothetical protein
MEAETTVISVTRDEHCESEPIARHQSLSRARSLETSLSSVIAPVQTYHRKEAVVRDPRQASQNMSM